MRVMTVIETIRRELSTGLRFVALILILLGIGLASRCAFAEPAGAALIAAGLWTASTPYIVVGVIVVVSIIVCGLIDTRRSTKRIIQTAMRVPVPDATEQLDVPTQNADEACKSMGDRLARKVGPNGRVEIESLMMLDGYTHIVGAAYKETS